MQWHLLCLLLASSLTKGLGELKGTQDMLAEFTASYSRVTKEASSDAQKIESPVTHVQPDTASAASWMARAQQALQAGDQQRAAQYLKAAQHAPSVPKRLAPHRAVTKHTTPRGAAPRGAASQLSSARHARLPKELYEKRVALQQSFWLDDKPVDPRHEALQEEARAQRAHKSRQQHMAVQSISIPADVRSESVKELSAEASDLHLWINGKPVVNNAADELKRKRAFRAQEKRGKRVKKRVAATAAAAQRSEQSDPFKHLSFTIEDLAEDDGRTDNVRGMTYSFGVSNMDPKTLRSAGELHHLEMRLNLPPQTSIDDAYFYLEHQKGQRTSQSCSSIKNVVTCTMPYVLQQTDLFVHVTFPKGSSEVDSKIQASLWHEHKRLSNIVAKATP